MSELDKSGAKTPFSTISQFNGLTAHLTAYIFGMKHHIDNRVNALKTTKGLLHRLKISWTLVHKRLKLGPALLSTLRKFCFLLHCQASQLNQTLPNGRQQIVLTICCKKVGVVFPKYWGPKNFYICPVFRRLRDL